MLACTDGVTHVMQAIEKSHQIIAARRKTLGIGLRERDAVADARLLRKGLGAFDRGHVVVEREELRIWISLRHYNRRSAMTAAHVGHLGAGLQFRSDAVKRRNPVRNQ